MTHYRMYFGKLIVALLLAATLWPASRVTAQPFRTIDGSGNNAANSDWGQADMALLRLSPNSYPDGVGDVFIQPPNRPNARVISNALFDQNANLSSTKGLSSGVWQWGQFLDHDIDLSPGNENEPHMIYAPANDPDGMAMIPMTSLGRWPVSNAGYHAAAGTNEITAYIDGSNVYGSDQTRADALREG